MKEYQVELEDSAYRRIDDDTYKELLKLGYKIAELNDELATQSYNLDIDVNYHDIAAHFVMLGNIAYSNKEEIE